MGERVRLAPEALQTTGSKRTKASGWLATELSDLVGTRPITILRYCERGLIAKPQFRGRSTRYSRESLVRLLAIKLWRLDGAFLSLATLRSRLRARTPQQLETWVLSRPISQAVRDALERTRTSSTEADTPPRQALNAPPSGNTQSIPSTGRSPTPPANGVGVPAQTVQLIPGLELSLRDSAGPAAQKAFLHLQAELAAWMDRLVK